MTKVEKLLVAFWAIPLIPGFIIGVRNYNGSEDIGLLPLPIILSVMWVIATIGVIRGARRRERDRTAGALASGGPEEDREHFVQGRLHFGHGYIDTPRERGRLLIKNESWFLLIIIPVGIYLLLTDGDWTILVAALHVIAVYSMYAYFNERDTEDDPAK